jgi:electron transfer flavoprotein beta subunit
VLVVSCGGLVCQDVLRTALAMGADRAVLLETEVALQPLGAAKLLKALALREAPQLVLMGKQAIDDDACQTGQMLAAMLGWPQGCFASKCMLNGHSVQVTREIDGGLEVLELSLPALVTADLRLNEPRFVSLVNLMKARKQLIEVLPAASLGVDFAPRLQTLHYAAPAVREAGVRLASVAELAAVLRQYVVAGGVV